MKAQPETERLVAAWQQWIAANPHLKVFSKWEFEQYLEKNSEMTVWRSGVDNAIRWLKRRHYVGYAAQGYWHIYQ